MKYSVYFDGTSYFVESADMVMDSETEKVFTNSNLQLVQEECDSLNEEV